MNEQAIANLFAQIGFKVDLKGIQDAKAALKHLEQQANTTGKAIDRALKSAGGGGGGNNAKNLIAAQKAATQQQFAAQLQGAKMTALNSKSAAAALQTQQQQVKTAILQQKLAAATANTQAQAAKSQLQQMGLQLANQAKQLNMTNRTAAAQQQHQLRSLRIAAAQARATRQANGLANNHRTGNVSGGGGGLLGLGRNAVHRFGGVGSFASGSVSGGGSGAIGSFDALASGALRASTGLGAIVGASALVVAAFGAISAAALAYGREAERAANTRNQRLGQFEAVGDRSPENARRMNNRFENFAQENGLSTRDLGEPYAKLAGALAGKVGVDKGQDITEGYMRFAVAQHLSNEDLKRSSLGMRQALGFGQLKAQETNQIIEPLGAHGLEYMSEAWQRAKGGNLKGDAASKEFLQDREKRKISGDMLIKLIDNFSQVLDSHANDGDLLNKARHTQNAWDNRISNQYQANLAASYENTPLHQAMAGDDGLYDNFVKFLHEIEPQFESLGRTSASVLNGLTGVTKWFTSVAAFFNGSTNYFDPRFGQDMSNAFDELGTSLTALWDSIKDLFGIADEAGVFKTTGEVVIAVITRMIDSLTLFADAITGAVRLIEDALHSLGATSDADYKKITDRRQEVDDRRAQQMEKRELDLYGGGPVQDPAYKRARANNVDPTAPWRLTDGSDIPTLPAPASQVIGFNGDIPMIAAMSAPPLTAPVQPALNGQALAPSQTINNITLEIGPTTLSGVDPNAMAVEMDKRHDAIKNLLNQTVQQLSPPSNGDQSRGN